MVRKKWSWFTFVSISIWISNLIISSYMIQLFVKFQYRGLLNDSIFFRRLAVALTVDAMLVHFGSLGVTSILSSLNTPEPLMLTPKAALKLCYLLRPSLFVFESARSLDGCLVAAENPLDGEVEKRPGSNFCEFAYARFCMRSDVPLNSLLRCTLTPRFFLYDGRVLASSMRSCRTKAWKLTKDRTLLLLSAGPVERLLSDLVKPMILASFLATTLFCLFSWMAPFLAVLTSGTSVSLYLYISDFNCSFYGLVFFINKLDRQF